MRFEYDIAISFASEERNIAIELATEFSAKYSYRVFYDDYEQAKILGSDLEYYLKQIFSEKARYYLLLLSEHYLKSRWTNIEWQAAVNSAMRGIDYGFVLPIRIHSNLKLPTPLSTLGYIDFEKKTTTEVCSIIDTKISSVIETIRIIRLAESKYESNNFEEALSLVCDDRFSSNMEALRIQGYAYGKLHDYKKGIIAFERIISIIPDDFLSLFHLGIYCYRIGDFAKSVKYYELASKQYPNHPTILTDLPAARKKLKYTKYCKWLDL
jgi:tetratricopeptide (TPR) repeat protein